MLIIQVVLKLSFLNVVILDLLVSGLLTFMFLPSARSGKLAERSLMMKLMDKVVCSGAKAYDQSNFPAVHICIH